MAVPRTISAAPKAAFIDTSCLLAIAFREAGSARVAARLATYDVVFASGLLEAELKAAFLREGMSGDPLDLLPGVDWVYPDRPLTPEIDLVFEAGYLKGADAWHLACALFLAPEAKDLRFETLDARQHAVALELGFTPA